MELFAFVKFMAQLVIALTILHLFKQWIVGNNPDSDIGKALTYITAG